MRREIIRENYFLYHIVGLNQLMSFAPLHLHVKLKIVVQDHCISAVGMIIHTIPHHMRVIHTFLPTQTIWLI